MNKKSYVSGIIGGLIVGIISIIIVVITNIFVSKISPFLTITIPFSIFLGYELFKGVTNTKALITIMIISIVYLLITSLVIVPLVDMKQVGIALSFDNFKLVYTNPLTREAIMNNTLVSFVFNAIGDIIVFAIMKGDIKNNNSNSNNNVKISGEDIEFFDPDLY